MFHLSTRLDKSCVSRGHVSVGATEACSLRKKTEKKHYVFGVS